MTPRILTAFAFAVTFFLPLFGGDTYRVELLSARANTRSDQRPIPIGFYDAGAGKTFVTWMGANSAAVVKELDHATGKWSADKVVGVSAFVDKHNYPGMLRGPDGRIHVFYGCHNSVLRHAVSPNPLSIEGTWADGEIAAGQGASYPAPVVTGDGVFYVFFRDTRMTNKYSDDRPYQMVKSVDGGKTWTRHMVIDPFPRTTDSMCEVYNGKVTYQPASADGKQPARIHIAWTIAGEKAGRHAHAMYGRNVYYAWLNPANDHLYNIEGRDLGTHIDKDESDKYCQVLDTGIPEKGHLAGLMVSAHYRDNGAPLIVFDSRIHDGLTSATWDAKARAWQFTRIAGHIDPRETEKTGPDSFRVYRPEGRGVQIYETTDAGAHWKPAAAIEISAAMGDVQFVDNARAGRTGTAQVRAAIDRVHVIDNAHPGAKLLLTQAGDGEIHEARRNVYIASLPAAASAKKSTAGFPAQGIVPRDGGFQMDAEGYWVWDGSVVKGDDGLYHMFASRWPKNITFHPGWMLKSEVVHATAKNIEGPYAFSDVVLPARGAEYWDGRATHNPTIRKHGDTYLLFYMGSTHPLEDPIPNVRLTLEDPRCIVARANKRIGLATAKSPYGPWTRLDHPILDCKPGTFYSLLTSNPAPVVHEDGSVLMIFKSRRFQGTLADPKQSGMMLGLARAKHYGGPYEVIGDAPLFGPDRFGEVEDPFVWQSREGGYELIAKDMTGKLCGEKHAAIYACSADGENWTLADPPKSYTRLLRWDDGATQKMGQLERPFVYLENGYPRWLFCAGANGPGGFNNATKTWVVAMPLEQKAERLKD